MSESSVFTHSIRLKKKKKKKIISEYKQQLLQGKTNELKKKELYQIVQ